MLNMARVRFARVLMAAASTAIGSSAMLSAMCRGKEESGGKEASGAAQVSKDAALHPRPGAATAVAQRVPRRAGARATAGEPCFTRAQVARADGADGRPMWVTYRDGVYDVTAFRHEHPGGQLIEQAAGADVGPFWDFWAYHHVAPAVGVALEKYRLGKLIASDASENDTAFGDSADAADPYNAEPARGGAATQRILTHRPYCSETPYKELGAHYLTSADAMYVRNHSPVPDVAWPDADGDDTKARAAAAAAHEVAFDGAVGADDSGCTTLTLAQLEARFGTATITSVLQCAGNRAAEDIAATGPSGFTGTPYAKIAGGMVGNAQWSGVRLANVLPALFPKACIDTRRRDSARGEAEEWHVVFEGADEYSGSVPLSRVLERKNDCLLARAMNGKPLSPDHGFPCRALLPGIAGARNVKWVQSISLQRGPSTAPWNAHYYKDAKAQQIQELPLQSIILAPARGAAREGSGSGDTVTVSGIAYSGGSGRAVARVDVSTDAGKSWIGAALNQAEVMCDDSSASFGWVRWTAEVPLGPGPTEVVARATDAAGITQPKVAPKQRGYLYNGWSRVTIH